MTDDPVVSEVRRARAELSERCGHDLRRFGEMMREIEKESGRTYVAPKKKAGAGGAPS